MTPERPIPSPDVMQPPTPCPTCGSPERLFTPNAARAPYAGQPLYEPAWQCTRCGALEFIAPPDTDRSPVAAFFEPVAVDEAGCLWLAADCGDWEPIVRQHGLTVVFDLEEGLDRGIPAHPDHVIYVYFPITDGELPTLHKLHALARLGAELLREGERILVHCQMGLNRSALLAGLILVHYGVPGPAALAQLQARRPGALFNQHFADHLAAQPARGATF
jgi:protein-tyrosine phosphatase